MLMRILKLLTSLYRNNRSLFYGFLLLFILIFISLIGRLIFPESELMKADYGRQLIKPSAENLLGTDELGRDLLTLIVYGLGLDLVAVIVVLSFSLTIGMLLGGIAGFAGRLVDDVIMRFTDIFFAIPPFVLAMAITAALGKGIGFIMMSLIIASWPSFARLVRGQILKEKEKNYIEALNALSIPRWRIFFYHMLPNIIYPVLVYTVTLAGVTILYLAGLSYIGFGPGPFTPELGQLISRGHQHTFSHPLQVIFPGIVLFAVVLTFNFLGDGLRVEMESDTDAS